MIKTFQFDNSKNNRHSVSSSIVRRSHGAGGSRESWWRLLHVASVRKIPSPARKCRKFRDGSVFFPKFSIESVDLWRKVQSTLFILTGVDFAIAVYCARVECLHCGVRLFHARSEYCFSLIWEFVMLLSEIRSILPSPSFSPRVCEICRNGAVLCFSPAFKSQRSVQRNFSSEILCF